uniref:Uncharacterized protein n=1 Tax=Arundo donax TaxID=35708 RepID=A0A0A9E9K5_ARUDO
MLRFISCQIGIHTFLEPGATRDYRPWWCAQQIRQEWGSTRIAVVEHRRDGVGGRLGCILHPRAVCRPPPTAPLTPA